MIPRKALILTALIIAALFIGLIVYFLIPRSHIVLQIAPTDAVLTIDDNKGIDVSRGDKISLKPGDHTLKLSRDEFSTETVSISTKAGETKTVTIALTPQTDAAWAILKSDPESVAIHEGYGSRNTQQAIDTIQAENPAFKNLPINTQEYYIYPCLSLLHPTDPLKRAVCVDLVSEDVRDVALRALMDAGISRDTDEVYIGTDAKIRPIIHTDTYTVDYYHDIGTGDKPTFVIIATGGPTLSDSDLITRKDEALDALKRKDYQLDKINIVYVNPSLVKYNSSPDVSFPAINH